MPQFMRSSRSLPVVLSFIVSLGGCTRDLVRDDIKYAATENRCSGSVGADDSSLAVVPVPIAGFFVPHWNLNEIKADDYLKRCGDPAKLVNRQVEVNRTACIPAALTRIISLGVWQWCPANVSWQADVRP